MTTRFGSVPVVLVLAFGPFGCERAGAPRTAATKAAPDTASSTADPGARPDDRPRSEQPKPAPADPAHLAAQLAKLRHELVSLDGGIKVLVQSLAKERIEVVQLKDKVDELTAKQRVDGERLDTLANRIKKAEDKAQNGEPVPGIVEGKAELETGRKRFTANQKVLEAHESLLTNRLKARDALEHQLESLKTQKVELGAAMDVFDVELAKFKPRAQEADGKAQEAGGEGSVADAERLARIKKDMDALRAKIEAERGKLKLIPKAADTKP